MHNALALVHLSIARTGRKDAGKSKQGPVRLPARPCLAEPVPSEPTSPEATRGCAGGRGREGAASVDGDGGFLSS